MHQGRSRQAWKHWLKSIPSSAAQSHSELKRSRLGSGVLSLSRHRPLFAGMAAESDCSGAMSDMGGMDGGGAGTPSSARGARSESAATVGAEMHAASRSFR